MTAANAQPRASERRIDALDDPFWAGCTEARFLLHRCARCGRSYWPASSCVEHGGAAMEWVDSSGRGTLHSFVVVRMTHEPAFADSVPYNAAIVRLDEGVLFHTSIVDCPNERLEVGLRVAVVYDELAPGEFLPRFKPTEQGEDE